MFATICQPNLTKHQVSDKMNNMKKAVIFLDYNGTIEDILDRGGKVFNNGISKFIKHFDGKVDIGIITSAKANRPENKNKTEVELKQELTTLISILPNFVARHFKFLLQSSLKKLDNISVDDFNRTTFQPVEYINFLSTSKKEGVQNFLNFLDKDGNISTCVFVGDSIELDLPMLEADVGTREKYFIFPAPTKKHVKLDDDITYKLSFNPNAKYVFKQENNNNFPKDLKIIRTATKSYGVGKAFEYLTEYLNLKDKINAYKEKETQSGKVL